MIIFLLYRVKRSHSLASSETNIISTQPLDEKVVEEEDSKRNGNIEEKNIEIEENHHNDQDLSEDEELKENPRPLQPPPPPLDIIHVQPELILPIINAENEALSVHGNNEHLTILPIVLQTEVNNISDDSKNTKNSNNNNTDTKIGTESKDSITKVDTESESDFIGSTSESKLLNPNNAAQKWQEWWSSTTEQLTKNVKDRSLRAYDAISSITSSASTRRRKKRDSFQEPETTSHEVNKTNLNSGVGILHVELVSAYKVIKIINNHSSIFNLYFSLLRRMQQKEIILLLLIFVQLDLFQLLNHLLIRIKKEKHKLFIHLQLQFLMRKFLHISQIIP